ncbi:monovalent cation/H(+) antiporter subunit G [Klugiella xanthotipulae]|uniref:Multisubunit sodium/proton antiporter MrpG subunit n=1 Tax=Klugiella xanthotipulae TaxID=244735 RepID=A0A543I4Q9_9MICO|nr:monovalent cation/H(+) antiporter subunit G [Klugiella xanthotipulae]TQM65588.1 multisubunit sodium/proton antiporter MrpG subunit [Klugiella xanthotipulae]
MNSDLIRDLLTALLLVIGAALSVAAGVGILRFPDVLSRLHAGTKPQILGLTCILIAVVLQNFTWSAASSVIVILVIQYLTQPISAHLVGRSAYRADNVRRDLLIADELASVRIAQDEDDDDDPGDNAPAPPAA